MPSDTAPYPVTITLAIVAWLFTSTTDEILKAPYLVYSVKTAANARDILLTDTEISLKNITYDKSYKNVTIILAVDPPDEIKLDYPHGVQPEQPSWEGDTPPSITKDSFQHTFPIIQPDGQFNIIFTHSERDTAHIHIIMKYPDSKTADSVLLTKPNLATWLAEYHVWISAVAVFVLILLSASFLLFSPKPSLKLEDPQG
jgi:hypothetical protein